MLNETVYENYLAILKEELVPATGCTEPIALAFCAARMRKLLGENPTKIDIEVSGNILKNVKSVVVPNTNNQRGIKPAVAAGIIAGDSDQGLQVISNVTPQQQEEIKQYTEKTPMFVSSVETPCLLDIKITGATSRHTASVRITNNHTNVIYMSLDDEILLNLPVKASAEDNMVDKSCLNVEDIIRFADTVPMEKVAEMLDRQINYNYAIAEEGLNGHWGAEIGRIILEDFGKDIKQEAKAYAAAGSDARMSGCEMPVIILSGSGNQGITASVPVVRFARHIGATKEQLYRALLVSDLITIHQKVGIGRLSAYCGAISAGVGAGAGICYLLGGGYEAISHTVVNAVAILSGTICDGAKPSCAAKIAAAVDAGIMGYRMYLHHREFRSGEGIVSHSVDETIANIGLLASEGMQQTDKTIQQIMTECV